MMTPLFPVLFVLITVAVPLPAEAQAQPAAQPPAPAAPPEAVPDPQGPPTPPPNYTYAPGGRRDPFASLVNRGIDARVGTAGRRPDGVPGLAVNEIIVRGILQTPGGYVAMVQAPDGRTYTVRPGDQLLDGRVRTITAEALIIMQEVNDPLSLEKQREVRKPLRGGAEG
ncbi:MAG: pilus assembly protein PilP [Vicinamibacterales bacterium]|nr:pilus assembly protein PilP [Vicinamibacterales bacterium]